MFAWLVQISSGLDSQIKCPFERYANMAAPWCHGGPCKFVQITSTNISSLEKRKDLTLGEVSYLFFSYNIIISWLYTLNGFSIIFNCVIVQPKNIECVHLTSSNSQIQN